MSANPVVQYGSALKDADWPAVSVVIPTRDRPLELRRCLESVIGIDYPDWELIVVDQSQGELTGALVAQLCDGLDDLHCLRARSPGLSRARNLGLRAARGEIVAFLDDDCCVPTDWLRLVASAFSRHPDAGLVFGTVRDAVIDDSMYVPSYSVAVERRLTRARSAARAHGIGAGMYMRRALAETVGPFDVQLGSGGRFLSSEDWDYTFRALRSGSAVVETPTIVVGHYGGRPYAGGEAARLLRGNAYSHGALHVKLLRCGKLSALLLIAAELWEDVCLLRPLAPILRRGSSNGGRLLTYLAGLGAGLRAPVDRERLVFRERE